MVLSQSVAARRRSSLPTFDAAPAGTELRDPVPWVVGLFVLTFLTQRIAVPGLPVPVTVPLVAAWMVLALAYGVVELNRTRLLVWLGAAGLSGLLVLAQLVALANPFTSVNSWALWVVTWVPLVIQLRRRETDLYLRCARALALVGGGLAVLSLAFVGLQLIGVRYYDWLSTVLPSSLVVQGYNTTYPISYGSPLYKSNGFIALEPSFMSFFLGVTLICALLARVRVALVVLIAAGLLSTVAGSGLALVLVFLLVLGAQGRLLPLRRYALPLLVVGVLSATTVFGTAVLGRVTEVGTSNSSTSLRAVQPYFELWPYWISDPVGMFIGHGPGSSVRVVTGLAIDGLIVPSVAKVVFDYGLLGGAVLLALMVVAYLQSPSTAVAASLAASMFLLQSAAPPLVLCSVLVVTLWSPALGAPGRLGRVGRGSRAAVSDAGRRPSAQTLASPRISS